MTGHCAVASNHPRTPTCTYRLQFNRWFTFTQAREIVPYLVDLGVSDVYSSPYFQVSRESLHGYDITDHNKLTPRSVRARIMMPGSRNCTPTRWARYSTSFRTMSA